MTEIIDLYSLAVKYVIGEYPNNNNKNKIIKKQKEIKNKWTKLEAQAKKDSLKQELNKKRNDELKSFVINDIFMNEEQIKTMAVVYNITDSSESIEWINISNQVVSFTKADFGALIKQGSQKIKEIYFRYRKLKDNL